MIYIYKIYRNKEAATNGESPRKAGVVYSFESLHSETFFVDPDEDFRVVFLNSPSPTIYRTYERKKAYIRDKAIDVQHMLSDMAISYFDLACIGAYFEKYGKRYGLLTEFRENGVI